MPFIGKDWRSPGEAWVKTSDGWERKKILEHRLLSPQSRYVMGEDNVMDDNNGFQTDNSGFKMEDNSFKMEDNSFKMEDNSFKMEDNSFKMEDNSFKMDNNKENENEYTYDEFSKEIFCEPLFKEWQPHCQITLKNTKEVAGYNLIGEAFQQLDFRNAVHDIRRFNYICKLLHLLISQNLTTLSGRATQVMFAMLEEVAWQVASDQQNIHILHMLLTDLKKYLKKYFCWGRPLGSTVLWKQHLQTIGRICNVASRIKIKGPDDGSCQLTDLPIEVIREILLRLNDYKDLESSAKAYDEMKILLQEQHIWRELCRFHFTDSQLCTTLGEDSSFTSKKMKVDWKDVFHTLRKKYGLREEYPDCLLLCRYCRCLFWKSFGHPCVEDENLRKRIEFSEDGDRREDLAPCTLYTPIPPQAFLKFFSL